MILAVPDNYCPLQKNHMLHSFYKVYKRDSNKYAKWILCAFLPRMRLRIFNAQFRISRCQELKMKREELFTRLNQAVYVLTVDIRLMIAYAANQAEIIRM